MNTIINLIQEESKRLYEFAVSFFESTRDNISVLTSANNKKYRDKNKRKEGV